MDFWGGIELAFNKKNEGEQWLPFTMTKKTFLGYVSMDPKTSSKVVNTGREIRIYLINEQMGVRITEPSSCSSSSLFSAEIRVYGWPVCVDINKPVTESVVYKDAMDLREKIYKMFREKRVEF